MMETYCVSCKKNTANENSGDRKSNQNRIILLFVYGKKKSRTPHCMFLSCHVRVSE